MMLERANRTSICSVLFLDIVDYSRKPVAEQVQLRDRVNDMIANAIRDIPAADRIVLDTGDGIAINFLGDPEDSLFVAMSLRDSFAPDRNEPPEIAARIGINLGPVRMATDQNGQPSVIGDGINVSQRIMSFAKSGQILVSRSYFEVVSHISDGNVHLFSYEGTRTDKQVREHEIYSVGYSGSVSPFKLPAQSPSAVAAGRRSPTTVDRLRVEWQVFVRRVLPWLNNRSLAYGTALFSSGAFLLAIFSNVLGTPPEAYKRPPAKLAAKPVKNVVTNSDAQAQAATVDSAADETTDSPEKSQVSQTEAEAEPQEVASAEPEAKPVKKRRFLFFRSKPDPEPDVAQAAQDAENTPESEQGAALEPQADMVPASEAETPAEMPTPPEPVVIARATVALAIAPWGEVYVDGNLVGVSPPVNKVELRPGLRKIEIRNGAFPAFTEEIDLKAGQDIKIRHKFN